MEHNRQLSWLLNPTTGYAYATNNTPGQGTISAVINTGCGNITLPAKAVWVGVPIVRNVSGPSYNQLGAYAGYSATADGVNATSSYNWSLIPGIFNNYFNPGYNCYITWNRAGQYVLQVNAQNTCPGTSSTYYYPISVVAGRYLSISPNPATSEATVELVNASTVGAVQSPSATAGLVSASTEKVEQEPEWSMEVYDAVQNIKAKTPKTKGNKQKLNTSGWKDGVYIVRANVNGEVVTGKLVVKK